MKSLIKIILLTLLLTLSIFAKDVATVTGLNGNADIDRHGRLIKVKLGNKLQEKDIIITNANAKVQVVFEDETIVTVGKNSRFSIDEYLFEDSQEPVARFGMLKGAMRTITGKIGKIAPRKFSVQTKTATIGIRGTNFTILEREDGSQNVFCTYGAISVSTDGIESIVHQGFYADIIQSGAVEIKAFTPKELKSMQDAAFVKGVKSKNGDDDSLEDGTKEGQLDTTKDDTPSGIIVKDITNSISDAKHTSTPKYPLQQVGYGVGNFGTYSISLVEILSTTSFNPESLVTLPFIDNRGDWDAWLFNISPTPLNYISKEEFKTYFTSAKLYSASGTYIKINESHYNATGDDLADGDYMSWGTWSASLEHNNHTYEIENALWVSGLPTDLDVVKFMDNEQEYSGIYKAVDYSNHGTLVDGEATMLVDFGTDRAELNIDYKTGRDFDMVIDYDDKFASLRTKVPSNIHDELPDNIAGGHFYGPNADAIGGNFSTIHNGSQELSGVYQVVK